MASSRKSDDQPTRKRPPARTPEAQENHMISLAINLAEKQLTEGTASPTTINHFLKLATVKEQREREKLALENELLKARTDQITFNAQHESDAKAAMEAFKIYSGRADEADNFDD